jgi:hypothetical protein
MSERIIVTVTDVPGQPQYLELSRSFENSGYADLLRVEYDPLTVSDLIDDLKKISPKQLQFDLGDA